MGTLSDNLKLICTRWKKGHKNSKARTAILILYDNTDILYVYIPFHDLNDYLGELIHEVLCKKQFKI